MILDSLDLSWEEFERATGWAIRPEGACKGERCVAVPGIDATSGRIDVRAFADRLGMPIVSDERRGLHALGPESGGRVLQSAVCPEIRLPDLEGCEFALSSLRGRKVVMVAWASW